MEEKQIDKKQIDVKNENKNKGEKDSSPHDPAEDLRPGEMNTLILRSKSDKPVQVYNRFVKGMCGTVLVDLTSENNGIRWDMPSQIIVTLRSPCSLKSKTTSMALCKLIATNREIFGSTWRQCPLEPVYERYSSKGVEYWDNAMRHCYWSASNAGKDVYMAVNASVARESSIVGLLSKPAFPPHTASVNCLRRQSPRHSSAGVGNWH